AARHWVAFDARERQEARRGRADTLAKHLGIIDHRLRRSGETAENRQRDARIAARRVDRSLDGLCELRNALGRLIPFLETLAPSLRDRFGVLIDALSFGRRRRRLDPLAKVRRTKFR